VGRRFTASITAAHAADTAAGKNNINDHRISVKSYELRVMSGSASAEFFINIEIPEIY
jgi:hypothetical protein